MRINLQTTRFSDRQHTDQNALASALLTQSSKISSLLVHIGGKETKRYPILTLTEGSGFSSSEGVDHYSYEYDIKTPVTNVRNLAAATSGSNVGQGGVPFQLKFQDMWFPKDYTLVSESGIQARIMKQPVREGSNYTYTVQLVRADSSLFVPASDLRAGAKWGLMFASVAVDWSRGNASNWTAPGKVRGKLTKLRKSYNCGGSVHRNQVVNVTIEAGGKKTNKWMDYEQWLHLQEWQAELHRYCLYGQSSYDANGQTHLKDMDTGQSITVGHGLLEQIQNQETYSSLTANRLKNVIGDLFFSMKDTDGGKEIVLLTGRGGIREFDEAMKSEVNGLGLTDMAPYYISGSGSNLEYGGYFSQYKTIDGHVVRVVHNPEYDHGPVAEAGAVHPESGWPLESYRMTFLDTASYNGQKNLHMLHRKGEQMKRWGVAGATIPGEAGRGNEQFLRANDIDGYSVHYLATKGVVLKRFDTSLDFQCVAS